MTHLEETERLRLPNVIEDDFNKNIQRYQKKNNLYNLSDHNYYMSFDSIYFQILQVKM